MNLTALIWTFVVFVLLDVLYCSIISTCKKEHVVALTFDEGPSKAYTLLILKQLEEAKVKATFHISTKYLQTDPEIAAIARQIIKQGHLLGLRFDPQVSNLINISPSDFKFILRKDRDIIKTILGYNVKYLRLPYGSFPIKAISIAEKMGFIITEHSFDSVDYEGPVRLLDAYKKQLLSSTNFIAVHRDTARATSLQLPHILALLKRQKIHPVPLSECI